MGFSTQKRFIAGATCPRCGQVDKVVAFSQEGKDYRECVKCGFSEQLRLNSPERELTTRVNIDREQIARETTPIKIVDTDKN